MSRDRIKQGGNWFIFIEPGGGIQGVSWPRFNLKPLFIPERLRCWWWMHTKMTYKGITFFHGCLLPTYIYLLPLQCTINTSQNLNPPQNKQILPHFPQDIMNHAHLGGASDRSSCSRWTGLSSAPWILPLARSNKLQRDSSSEWSTVTSAAGHWRCKSASSPKEKIRHFFHFF